MVRKKKREGERERKKRKERRKCKEKNLLMGGLAVRKSAEIVRRTSSGHLLYTFCYLFFIGEFTLDGRIGKVLAVRPIHRSFSYCLLWRHLGFFFVCVCCVSLSLSSKGWPRLPSTPFDILIISGGEVLGVCRSGREGRRKKEEDLFIVCLTDNNEDDDKRKIQ